MAVYRKHGLAIDQGDIFLRVPFVKRSGPNRGFTEVEGIVTSHGCQCERHAEITDPEVRRTYPVHLAPCHGVEIVTKGALGDIRRGRVRRYFYLAAEDDQPERLVDLFYDQPIPVVCLIDLTKRASVSEDTWSALLVHMWAQRSHIDPAIALRDDWMAS